MRNRGLRNRFSDDVRNAWLYHHECLVCKLNQWDALHHIISPSSSHYVDGKHNESVLNSCPIHNNIHPHDRVQSCHVGNETWLNSHIPFLLKRVFIIQVIQNKIILSETDNNFITVYKNLYEIAE